MSAVDKPVEFSDESFDLSKHSSISASAGTGKTYALTKIVGKILREQIVWSDAAGWHKLKEGESRAQMTRCGIGNVLLVTYTEKAAGELKKRIRDELETMLADKQNPFGIEFIQAQMAVLDEANIQTIHAFCSSVLNRYPFESSMPLRAASVDEEVPLDLYDAEWRKMMREMRGEDLESFESAQLRNLPRWAKEFNPETDCFPDGDGNARLYAKIAELKRRVLKERARLGVVDFDDMIRLTRKAVETEDSPLVKVLRKKYAFGIIDEFQDTNADEWTIFEKMFLDSDVGNRLIVVGDPKQSIYRFQGADVNTYFAAVKAIVGKGCAYGLTKNRRSTKTMVDDYCGFFSSPQWSSGNEEHAGGDYWKDVKVDSACQEKEKIDKNGNTGLRFWKPPTRTGEDGKEEQMPIEDQRREYYRGIAGWISENCGGGKERKGIFCHENCAILVRNNFSGIAVLNFLRKNGIPCSFYKRKDLYNSPYAVEWIAILDALLDPGRKLEKIKLASLGFFFGVSEEELPSFSRESDLHGIATLFEHALSPLAKAERWSDLFAQLWLRTDFARRMVAFDFAGEEALGAFNQLREDSLNHLESSSGGLKEEILRLSALRDAELDSEQDRNLLSRATDRPCVQVMTMHASKGLEFDIVFCVPTALKNKNKAEDKEKEFWATPDDKEKEHSKPRLRFVGEASEEYWRQEFEEAKRLLYVAITRAKQLCFVPTFSTEDQYDSRGFLKLIKTCAEGREFADLNGWKQMDAGSSVGKSQWNHPGPMALFDVPEILIDDFGGRSIGSRQSSYSDIARTFPKPAEPEDRGDFVDKDGKLRRGVEFGRAMHKIFELGDWNDLACLGSEDLQNPMLNLVREQFAKHGVPIEKAGDLEEALKLIRNTLNQTVWLYGCERPRALKDLDVNCRAQEVEFFFSVGDDGERFAITDNRSAGNPPNYVKGEIDLLYSYTDDKDNWRMGILDWKTSSVRENDRLEEMMLNHHYELQAQIYTDALDHFLKTRIGDGYAREKNLAKPIYVFLRACGTGKVDNGVWTPGDEEWRADRWAKLREAGADVKLVDGNVLMKMVFEG